MDRVSLDHVIDLAIRLPPADQVRLIAKLAMTLDQMRAVAPVEETPRSSARALLAHAGAWSGNDLEERLTEVYASRQPVEA